jgi:hypothetical protein
LFVLLFLIALSFQDAESLSLIPHSAMAEWSQDVTSFLLEVRIISRRTLSSLLAFPSSSAASSD